MALLFVHSFQRKGDYTRSHFTRSSIIVEILSAQRRREDRIQGSRCQFWVQLWGDLFSKHVLRLLRRHSPTYLIMENVANLERHNGGRTWKNMRRQLEGCGYNIETRVLSPHFFGVPQIRERLFIVGSRVGLDHFSWPERDTVVPNVDSELDVNPPDAKALPNQVIRCLEVWQDFLDRSPKGVELPSFPI